MENNILLSVRNLSKSYAAHKAVNDISFDIENGSIFGLLGPNGAGKSTLLRMITGIFYQDSGEIILDGKPFQGLKNTELIGYMPEERGLYKKMKVGEHILYLAQLKGLNKTEALERAKYWVDRLEMNSWWNKKVEDLSKGMSQKLQFVATVIHNPKLLILDEPFSGLDPVNANVIKEEIFRLSKEGTTIIFSTHRMEQVEEICDKIVLINLGQKLLDGSVQQVKQDYKEHIFNLELAHPMASLPDRIKVLDQKEHFLRFQLEEGRSANDILLHFIQQQNNIISFQEHLPSLNDIFIKIVGATPNARPFDTF
ncbi:ABC transporter ATP-binding protein [Taibaiella sp. KBW10]|uniref:ABC transporter ATP-binding protein n=1 Tax=Taibaiella sp. KBW10 TaxID=2153357 RepID=UPI000F5B5B21|nr:ATP-binding cassette domain-containing protein [Taibaiella sp. KBW10]RQO30970.1 ABC transporter ATP-binding protein [Taibaiella sp. KBW10]